MSAKLWCRSKDVANKNARAFSSKKVCSSIRTVLLGFLGTEPFLKIEVRGSQEAKGCEHRGVVVRPGGVVQKALRDKAPSLRESFLVGGTELRTDRATERVGGTDDEIDRKNTEVLDEVSTPSGKVLIAEVSEQKLQLQKIRREGGLDWRFENGWGG